MIYETFDNNTLREIDDLIGEIHDYQDYEIPELHESEFDFNDYLSGDYDY